MMTGAQVWKRLRAEGGFVHTMADGRQFVRFNRGYHPSAELVKLLKSHREELKAFIIERHADADRHGWGIPRGQGTSQAVGRQDLKARDPDICDCNAEMRSNISAETPSKWNFSHRRGISGASMVAALVLSASLAACGEILQAMPGRLAVPVDLASALLTSSSSGSGEVSTQKTNGGMVWKKN